MYELQKLNRDLRQSEYETATALFSQAVAAGYPELKAVAMVYRAGLADGISEAKRWRNEYYKLKHSTHESTPSNQQTDSPLAAESEENIK